MDWKQKRNTLAIVIATILLGNIILHFITNFNWIVSTIIATVIGVIIGVIAALFLISSLKHQPRDDQKQ